MPSVSDFHYTLIAGTTNPIDVNLNLNHIHKKMYLLGYSINGAPVTGGIPTNSYYNLVFDNSQVPNGLWARNDNLLGYPLPILGAYTYNQYNPPILLRYAPEGANLSRFSLRLVDDTGATATYTKAVFWFYFE
jgi:hypothetical protein